MHLTLLLPSRLSVPHQSTKPINRHTLEILFFVATLVRVLRQLPGPVPELPFVFVSGINTVVITALRPFVTRDTWRRVVGASTWPRLLAYAAGKVMVGGGRQGKMCGSLLAFACCCCYRCGKAGSAHASDEVDHLRAYCVLRCSCGDTLAY